MGSWRLKMRAVVALNWADHGAYRRPTLPRALILMVFLPFLSSGSPPDWACHTGIGEHKICTLPDGSVAELNTATDITAHFSSRARIVHLWSGEAWFRARHNPIAPFRVSSGDTLTQDIGSEFDVFRMTRHSTRVIVTFGEIAVFRRAGIQGEFDNSPLPAQTLEFGARHRIDVPDDGEASARKLTSEEVQRLLAWRSGSITFNRARLAEVVGELMRYNVVQFVYADRGLESRAGISGSVPTTNVQACLDTLRFSFGIGSSVATRRDDTRTITLFKIEGGGRADGTHQKR